MVRIFIEIFRNPPEDIVEDNGRTHNYKGMCIVKIWIIKLVHPLPFEIFSCMSHTRVNTV
jgi:hypothetical protein